MQRIINCPFIGPKYRQLIYWITTDTLCSGTRLHHYSPRGMCPHCTSDSGDPIIASWRHMFFECSTSTHIWMEVDMKGHLHWGDEYQPLDPNEVPTLISEYRPFKLLQLSTLWAIWVHWCKYFHDEDNFTYEDRWDWNNIVLLNIRDQFKMRMHESHSAVQWLLIVDERRLQLSDKDPAAKAARIPEKEFLLTHSWSINTNSEGVTINDVIPPQIQEWFGENHLITLDYKDGQHLTPRMKFNLLPWDQYTRPPEHDYPADYNADSWRIVPRNCLCDY